MNYLFGHWSVYGVISRHAVMDRINFKINGKLHSVGHEVSSDLTLLEYIRTVAELRGTKYMCREGGCGACIVSTCKNPGAPPQSVNSCLVSITSCKDWDITTVEEVGNRLDGYSPIQTTLAEYNGTQCGYCTPGWVMSMYSLIQSKKHLTPLEIEKSFASNICRCTGYRPILDAFKTFATDSQELPDIEDLKICKKTGEACSSKTKNCEEDEWCVISKDELKPGYLQVNLKDGRKWFRINLIIEIFSILYKEGDDSYMLVNGNTAKGAYPILEYPRILIDISGVHELKGYFLDQNLVIGAGVTLSELMEIWKLMSNVEYFGYLFKFYQHLDLVAHIPVRNIGTLAGNLMIKHQHNDFPSDIFLLLETVGAQLTILNAFGQRTLVTMQQFLRTNMRTKVILNVLMPPLGYEYILATYKIMPRAQNVHAIVNAGFLYKISKYSNTVLEARIVYGGLSPTFVRALKTETFLLNRPLFTNDTLQGAIGCLKNELIVVENPPEPSANYRKALAINLFYKGLLELVPASIVNPRFASGAIRIKETRPVSQGRQIFDTNPALWPLNKPIPKVEALIQCAGEAPYSEDVPSLPHEVFAAFVLSEVPKGTIVQIDPSRALACPGVIAFYTAKDIPGVNSFTPSGQLLYPFFEEIVAEREVKYFNQPIGIIVAETRAIADRARHYVTATYSNVSRPVVDIKEARKDPARNTLLATIPATGRGANVAKTIKGETTIYGQYHFTMETLLAVTKPTEEGMEVFTCSQWVDGIQEMVARVNVMQENKVDVYIRRCGGAYGLKISRTTQEAVACSLVTRKLNRPCRLINSLTTNTRAVGKRLPCIRKFEVQVDNKGEIQYMNYDLSQDHGFFVNEPLSVFGLETIYNCYNSSRWNIMNYNTITDTAKNTWCRAPGTLETISMTEILMEQISYEMSLDSVDVRLANLDDAKYGDLRTMVNDLKEKADYNKRRAEVNKFNQQNRWKKRGIRTSFSRWKPSGAQYFDVTVSVFHFDGSVAITHGGIEIGQGINTKAVQIAAYLLKIPIEKIQIKANTSMITPNAFITGGSLTCQNIGVGVERACKKLLARLEPVRNRMNNPTWEELITRAFELNLDLQAHGFVNQTTVQDYDIYGVAIAEVEVDVLTGQYEIIRCDILQDVGRSVSPEIDVGQIEGAFVMGLGYWTVEELVYNKNNGELLTDRTWNYYVPQARDIPQDFRVYFRKNSYSSDQFFGAKASGEPPSCLSVVITFALREAISQARLEMGIPTTKWFDIDGPFTVEQIYLATETKQEIFKFS